MMLKLLIVFLACVYVEPKLSNVDVKVSDLKVEYEKNPLGVDVASPRFSWVITADVRSVIQTGYEVTVRKNSTDGEVVWHSREETNSTFGIEYDGNELEPTTVYFWEVVVRTNVGDGVSEMAWFETGLMNPKIAAWEGAEWLTSAHLPDVVNYTIEYDFHLIKNAVGFAFSSDGKDYLMWQIYANPNRFRPHHLGSVEIVLAEVPVSNVIPDTDEGRGAWYRMRIVVRSGTITTAIAPRGGEFVTVDENRKVEGEWPLRKVGFREDASNEEAQFDNIIINNNDNGKNDVIYNETFDEVPSDDYGTHGTVKDGVFDVNSDTFFMVSNVVDRGMTGGLPLFRKVVNVDKDVLKARLYATARGYYEYSINGEKVGDVYLAPGWTDYFFTIMYQVYDVTNVLKEGANGIGAMLAPGWFSSPLLFYGENMYGSTQSVLGKLVIEYKNGTRQVVVTDNTWKTHGGPVFSATNYYGETYDAQYDCSGWSTANYNDSEWLPAGIHDPVDVSVDIVNQIGPPVRVVHRFENPKFTEPLPGKYTYDFGQNMAGVVSIKVKGAAGVKLTIRHAEMLNTDIAYQNPGEGSVNGGDGPPGTVYRINLRGGNISINYYTLKGDANGETYTPRFTFHGFRYVEISGIDTPIPAADVTALALSSDNEQTSSLESSNIKVDKLYSNVVWGMRGNFVSIPTDCPNRDERLGWTGDTQIFSGTAVYLSNSDQFYAKWLRDLRSYQKNKETSERDKGLVPVVIPAVYANPSNYSFGNFWGDCAVTIPWAMYKQFGDIRIVRESIESMRAWCDFLNANPRSVDFIRPGSDVPRDAQYGDWVSVEDSPKDMTNTLGTAYVNKLFAKMAAAVGLTDDAKKYNEICANITQAFNKKFRNADGTLTATTQTPYAMLLYFDLATDDNDRVLLAQTLAKNINDHGGKLTSGFIGVAYLTPSLSRNQQAETAFTLLEQEEYPSWIYSINQGATTPWERWNSFTLNNGFGPSDMNSFNHYAFGSIGEWLMSGLLGIRPDETQPGYREFLLDPQIGGTLSFARGYYDSVVGRIASSWIWNRETGAYWYNCTVPANTRATVFIPADTPLNVTESGHSAYDSEGVTYVGYNGVTKREIFGLASGSYVFGSTIKYTV